jgi:hypothetical protein
MPMMKGVHPEFGGGKELPNQDSHTNHDGHSAPMKHTDFGYSYPPSPRKADRIQGVGPKRVVHSSKYMKKR